MNGRARAGIVALALLSVTVWWVQSRRQHGDDTRAAIDAMTTDGGMFVPAAEADPADGLTLRISREAGVDRRYKLEVGGGTALLTLKPRKASTAMGFGACTLETTDRAAGAAFVHAVAAWLKTPDGAGSRPENPLVAVPCSYVQLGGGDDASGWVVSKLFLRGADDAEIFLRISKDERRADLVEKDEDYRAAVVTGFALALRDGPTPRRSTKVDPRLASDEPLLAAMKPLPAGAHHLSFTWLGGRLLGASLEGKRSKLRLWSTLDAAPREIAEIDGTVGFLVADPTSSRVAITVSFPETEGAFSTSDPGAELIVDLATGQVSILAKSGGDIEVGVLANATWSPRGDALAFAVDRTRAAGGGSRVLVFDPRTGAKTSEAPVDARPLRWDEHGFHLERTTVDRAAHTSKKERLVWTPGAATTAPDSASPTSQLRTSPDGLYRLDHHEKSLVVTSKSGARAVLDGPREGDPYSVGIPEEGSELSWVGPHGLLLPGREVVLDLATMKLRLLFSDDDQQLLGTSPDGTVSLIAKGGETFFCKVPMF